MKTHIANKLIFLLIANSLLWAAPANLRKELATSGLIITYKCKPEQRVTLRRYMLSEGLTYFSQLQKEARVGAYHVFFSRYVDNESWDMVVLVLFSKQAGVANWRQIESQMPAGLSAIALQTVQAISTTPVTYFGPTQEKANQDHSVFLIIPYKVMIPKADYLTYFNSYVIPQLQGWQQQRNLTDYSLSVAEFPAERDWSSLLILEYPDDSALADRDKTVAAVRETLQNDRQWKVFANQKINIRTEGRAVVSDEIQVPVKH